MSTEILKSSQVKLDLILAGDNALRETLTAAEKLEAPAYKAIATAAGLKAEPFDKNLLRPVILGIVQAAWFEAAGVAYPEKNAVNQSNRVSRYLQQLAELASNDGDDLVVSRKPRAKSNLPVKEANLYRLVSATEAVWSKFAGQKFVVVETMKALGAIPNGPGVSVATIVEKLVSFPGIVPPGKNNVSFHVNAFGHEGIVERVNADGTVAEIQKPNAAKEPEKQTTTPPAETTKKSTPPPSGNKKKK